MAYNVPLSSLTANDGNVTYGQNTILKVGTESNITVTGSLYESSGNVGVGTATPTQKLHVVGNIQIAGSQNGILFTDGTLQITSASTPTGAMMPYAGSTAPSGWVLCDNTAYDGSNSIYAALWSVIGTTYGGTSISNFRVPDLRGRIAAGLDNMGGSAASRLTSTTITPNGNTLGGTGGSQTASFAYSGTTNSNSGNFNTATGGGGSNLAPSPHTHTYSGSTTAASIIQPTIMVNYIIKL